MSAHRHRILIVDGYNVLRSGSRYQRIASPDYADDAFNCARETLVNDVVNFAGREYQATIVFDGGGNAFSTGEIQRVGGVRIMFSPAGHTADKVIEKLAREARERGAKTLVVTSDAAIQDAVFGFGVDRMSANGFSPRRRCRTRRSVNGHFHVPDARFRGPSRRVQRHRRLLGGYGISRSEEPR